MSVFLINFFCVGAGGFLGSILRYLLSFLDPTNQMGFPFVTFFINAIGVFAIAFITGYFLDTIALKAF